MFKEFFNNTNHHYIYAIDTKVEQCCEASKVEVWHSHC